MESPPGWTLTTAFPESLLTVSSIELLMIGTLSLGLSAYPPLGLVLRRLHFAFGDWRHVSNSLLHGWLRRCVTLRRRFGRRTHGLSRPVLPPFPCSCGLCGGLAKPGTVGAREVPREAGA